MPKSTALAQWQIISGITPENEDGMEYPQREKGLRALLKEVEAQFRADLNGCAAPGAPEDGERFKAWEPILKTCFNLGIARAKLSRYSREFNGLGIHEFYDAIRIETIKPLIKKRMAAFLKTLLRSGGKNIERSAEWKSPQDAARHCFLILRKSRREDPSFDRNQWVQQEYDFPNYTRFRRACLVVFVRTPQQLEYEALQELITELWKCNDAPAAIPSATPQGATFFTSVLAEPATTQGGPPMQKRPIEDRAA